MTSGALAAVIMMVFMELTAPRRRRLAVALGTDTLPKLEEFLRAFASRARWNAASAERLVLVGEETLASLLSEQDDGVDTGRARRLVVTARADGGGAELEFVSGFEEENLEDQLSYLGETAGHTGRSRDIVPPVEALRVVGAPPEVSRRRHRYGESRARALAIPVSSRPGVRIDAAPRESVRRTGWSR